MLFLTDCLRLFLQLYVEVLKLVPLCGEVGDPLHGGAELLLQLDEGHVTAQAGDDASWNEKGG